MKTLKIVVIDRLEIDRKKICQQINSLNHFQYNVYEFDTIEKSTNLMTNNEIDIIIYSVDNIEVEVINKLASLENKFPSISKIIMSRDFNQNNINELFDIGVSGILRSGNVSNEEIYKVILSSVNNNQSKKTLLELNKFFLSTINALSASIAILNETGTILYVNDAWRQFENENEAKLINHGIGLNYIDISFSSDDEDGIGRQVAQALKDIIEFRKEDFYIEYPCHSPNLKRWFSLKATSFEQNKQKIIVLSHENITKRREAENSLRVSDKIFNNSLDMLCIAGFDGYFKILNPAWERILGWSKDELLTKPWIDFVHPEDKLKTNNIKSVIVDGKEVYQFENRYICKDGSIKHLSWNSFPYPKENIMYGVARDVTERNKKESKLRILNKAIEQSPVSIVVTNVQGDIEYVNPKFTEITGYEAEEALGKNPRILKSGDKNIENYKNLWETILSGKTWHGEFFNRKKDGTSFWEDAKISPIFNSSKIITHFVAIKEDITIRKQTEIELLESKKAAEKSDRLKSEFLAQISHEIRTPINTLLCFSDLIKDELEDSLTDDLAESFQHMSVAGNRIMRTIDLLIKISELQTDNYDAEFIENDLVKLLDEIKNKYKFMAEKKGLQISFINNVQSSNQIFDWFSMYDVISNLVDNAIKFTEKGFVKIYLRTSLLGKAEISVVDSGVGISDNYMKDIFKLFSQETSGYSRKFDGNGLGLVLAKEYCKINNVELLFSSEKGVGSNFTLLFN